MAHLSDSLRENSGLVFFQDKLFTFNDGGNSAEIFQISSNNGKIQKIYSTGLANKDWEAITCDENHLYIGDFGNNGGSRKDLAVYKIPFKNGELAKDSIITLSYFYLEQEDFSFQNLNTNFDAEAMIFLHQKLHIFTKEWKSKGVSHYTISPITSEKQSAEKLEFFPTNFVVTDACYYNEKLYLVGYTKNLKVFLHIFDSDKNGLFFNGKHTKYQLGNALKLGQIEAIAINDKGIFISGEKFIFPLKSVQQSLYHIPWEKLK